MGFTLSPGVAGWFTAALIVDPSVGTAQGYMLRVNGTAGISTSLMTPTVYGAITTGNNLTLQPNTADSTTGSVIVNATTASTSTTTGALVVSGGAGIAGAVFIGGALTVSTVYGSSTTGNNLTLQANSANTTTGSVIITTTTAASSTLTGALIVDGGVGITKNCYASEYFGSGGGLTNIRSIVSTSGSLGALTVTTDTTYILTATSSATLPTNSVATAGQRLTFKNKGNFTTTITAAASQYIGSYSSAASNSFYLYAQEDYVTLEFDGTSIWYVVATNGPVITNPQTAQTTCNGSSAWTAIGNGLALSSLAPGIYDFEITLDSYVGGSGATISIAIGNATTPISAVVYDMALSVDQPIHISVRGYVLTSTTTINGIYYSTNAANTIFYNATTGIGKIIGRRIG
jgi:hypothetical protein